MTKSILWMSVLVLAIAGLSGCSSSDDGYGNIDTIAPATPLQKAFYMAEEDSRQPAWLQEKIKSNPYLKVYHSSINGGHYLLEYPSRAQTTTELYDEAGQQQTVATQESLETAVAASAPWVCTHVYTYPIKAGSDEWRALDVQERHAMLQLPDHLLGSMRTEDLILVCLDYPFAIDFFAFNDFQAGYMALYNEFNGLRELMGRDDLAHPFLLYLDLNWQKVELMKSEEDIAKGRYTLLSVVFKYMLAQDAVISRMSRSQLRSMLDLCIRNNQIEHSDREMWSGVNVEAIWYVYAKVIYNKGGFAFKDDREKQMFDAYIEHPQFYAFEEDGEIYYLFNEDFMERVLKYVEAF